MRCRIEHYDSNKMEGAPIVFQGRAWRTAWKYLAFLDESRTRKLFQELGEAWGKLP